MELNHFQKWNRIQGETSKQFEAFSIYRDMGPERSISEVAKLWSESGATSRLREWATKNKWNQRTIAYDDHIDDIRRAKNEETIIEMSARHADYSVQIQDKAMDALNLIKPEDLKPHELIKWINVAVNIERLSRGAPTENIRQEQEVKEVKDEITTEALKNPKTRKIVGRLVKQLANSKTSDNRAGMDSH